MRFVVYGAGAIGGVVGGRLHQAGHDVVLVARGRHLDAIQRDGLVLAAPEGEARLEIPAVAHPSELSFTADDVVVFAMKTQHTAAAAEQLANSTTAPTVVSAQNGVENERILLRRFPRVQGICVMCPTGHVEPGVVEAYSAPITGLLDIGAWPHGTDERTHEIAAALETATFRSVPRRDIARWKYGKLLMNLGNAVEALCRPNDDALELARRARREAVSVLRDAGIDFVDRNEDQQRRGDLLTIVPLEGRARGGGSSWQSLHRGTGNIEADYLNGEIVLTARLAGRDAPVNALLQREANRAAALGVRPRSIDAGTLLSRLP